MTIYSIYLSIYYFEQVYKAGEIVAGFKDQHEPTLVLRFV